MTRPMLWRGSGAAEHVSILGSIHFLDGEIPAWVSHALDQADRLVFEADISTAVGFPELPDDLTISTVWPSIADALEQAADATNTDFEILDRLRPTGAAALLSVRALMPYMQFNLGVEAVLKNRSAELFLQTDYLESHAEIYHLTMVMPDVGEQAAFLAYTIQGLSELPARVSNAAREWRNGNLAAAIEILDHARIAANFPTVARGMFQNRHELWQPRLVQYVEDAADAGETMLVVVGCGHLARPGNLFTYLEPYGLLFEQIT
jgi:uncharacterized protein YbaP (TraB family)